MAQYGELIRPRISDAYDFVTFDPRGESYSRLFHPKTYTDACILTCSGVGRSTPQAQRFPTQLASALWGETSLATFLPALSIPGNIGLTLAKGEVTNAIFGQNAAAYLPYINTPICCRLLRRMGRRG